jgi:hypothetical protein
MEDESKAALIEKLASLAHDQWIAWSKNLAGTEPCISKPRLERWKALWIPYAQLPEDQKEHDRKWARKYLAIIEEEGWLLPPEMQL